MQYVAGLAGTKGIAKPVRDGQEKATIKLDMGDLIVERIVNGKGNKLTVKSPEGASYPSPQRMLNELVGAPHVRPHGVRRHEAC